MAERHHARWTRRLDRGGGFTLFELAIIIAVLAVLSGVAAVSFVSTTANRASVAARTLQRDLTYARQRAMATGLPMWVIFDAAAETWDLREEDPDSPGMAGAATIRDPSDGGPMIEALGSGPFAGVGIASAAFDGAARVGFDWLGRPLNSTEAPLAATGSVTLTDDHQVQVLARSGHVVYVEP